MLASEQFCADLSDQDKGRHVVVCSRKVADSTGLALVWSLNDVRLLYIWQCFPMVRSCRSVERRHDYLDRDVLLHSSSCDRCSNITDFLLYSVLRRARSLASISFRFHCKLLHQHRFMETIDWGLTNFTHVARISENLNAIIEQDRLKRSDPLSAFVRSFIQVEQLFTYMETLCQTFKWTAGAALQIFYYAANFVHPLFGFISCWFTGKNELQYVLEKKIPKHDRVLQVEIYKTLATLCSENNLHNRKLKIRLKYCLQKIIAYEKLLKDVEDVRMIHYNPYDKAHESQLLKLSSLLKPESQISAIDPRWVELGFQGKDPSTDFRGMGLLGLQQLIYMCETEQQKSQAMLSRSLNPRHGYPFAIVGINMSFLTRELLREGHLKSFFYAKSTCKFPMQDLHDVYRYCFYRFDQLWAIYKPENEMAFGEIRAQLKADLLSELRAGILCRNESDH
ncbi:ELMO/CED-12 family protein [Trichinella nativa]|uniref:ELMO/CED-12 family protein n=1 Tax=Trichinella nativa TaxID=6335 RepID=A0A1Y3ECI9_9BILA|nr:ELMO/CED-12 family protein [Trichinella nativa]